MKTAQTKKILILILLNFASTYAIASSSCSATNNNNDQRCSISCPSGQTASCSDGTGSSAPTCKCDENLLEPTIFIPSHQKILSSSNLEKTNILTVTNTQLGKMKDFKLAEACKKEEVGRFCYREPCFHSNNGEKEILFSDASPLVMCPRRCEVTYENVCQNVMGKLEATLPLEIEKEPVVTIQEPNWKDIPQEIIGYKETYTNCTPEKQSFTFKHSETIRTGTRASKGKSIDTNLAIEASVKFTFKISETNQRISFNRKVSASESEEIFSEKINTLDFSLPVVIPENSKLVMNHYWIKRVIPIQYTGLVTIDAPIKKNIEHITRLSQVIKNPKDREFEFSGTITDASLNEGITSVTSKKLSERECQDSKVFKIDSEPYYSLIN